jgi:hypothetical protein
MNFGNVKNWVIPQGNVKKVMDSQNRIIWEKADYTEPFYVENITQNNETLSIQKDNNIAPTLTIEYSLDKSTWSTLGNTSTNSLTYSLNPGDKLYLRCNTTKWADYIEGEGVTYGNNTITGVSKVGGNIMSLLYGNSFTGNEVALRDVQDEFKNIFSNNTSLQSADSLLLPATTLHLRSYMNMFENCTNLTSAPDLNPTILANDSCAQMFEGCSSLQHGPMIYAQKLESASCIQMFVNCTSLNYIVCLATDISAADCTFQWMLNVGSTGTFYCANGMSSIWSSGTSGIPSGWTVVEV